MEEKKSNNIFLNYTLILAVYIISALAATYININRETRTIDGVEATHYNNYNTMRHSFIHMLDKENIYTAHPKDHWDLYKYSPAFAVFMGLFAYLPVPVGLALWNLLNALLLFYAIKSLSLSDKKRLAMIMWFLLVELFTNLQNSQSNGMMAGLMILTFSHMERGNKSLGSFCLAASIFVKLFSIALLPIFLFYPKKIRFLSNFALWIAIMIWLPLPFVNFEYFKFIYMEWFRLLSADYTNIIGLSIFGIFKALDISAIEKYIIVLSSAALIAIPFIFIGRYKNQVFRHQILAAIMLWCVVFNYRAESPTYIIAMAGTAIWYFTQEKTAINSFLLIIAFIFTSLSVTDITPLFLKKDYFEPYYVKAIPCVLIWFKLMRDLYFRKYKKPLSKSGFTEF